MNLINSYNVTDVMTGDLVSVMPDSRCGAALDILSQTGLHALPAIDSRGVAVGLVTMAYLVGADHDQPVRTRFSGPPISVTATTTVPEAARVMREQYVHHLIVTDGPTAIGMLSSYDLLKLLESNS